jgi:sigma-70-like protein
MSRRRGSQDDPTARRALISASIEATGVLSELEKMLRSLNPREAGVMSRRWGLHDGQRKTWDEIGREFGVTRERIRQIERNCLDKLREQINSSPLAVTDGGQIIGIVDVRHTGIIPPSMNSRDTLVLCPQCNERRFLPDAEPYVGGRRRKYCSNACRQAAYRARRSARNDTDDAAGNVSGR